jgi:hypothetical protein
MLLKIILLVLLLAIGAAIAWGMLRTYKIERDARQALFAGGTAKPPAPGKYAGTAGDYRGPWQGKVLYENGRGENVFRRETGEELKYPFAYSIGQGVRDKNLEVIVLDYNQPGNPWWLRFIRDEMVATGDNQYLGKVHAYVLPNVYFSLGYFELTLR